VVPRGEERDEVRHRASLTLGEAIEAALARTDDSEMPKFAREPRAVDPPEELEQLDERDAGGIRRPEQVDRSRPCPRRTGWIQKGSDVSRIATHSCAQGPHRETGAFEDFAEVVSELIIWRHIAILSGHDRTSPMVAANVIPT
jgi:hypothetical protein